MGDYEILCLNDASTDDTLRILNQLSSGNSKVRVLSHTENRGIYESFSELAREAKGKYVYQTAADDQWPADNLRKLYQASNAGHFDVVIGVRKNRSQIYSLWRQILSASFNLIPRLFFGLETKDANGIKLGKREIFNLQLISHSFFGEIERLIEARRLGYRIGYEPIQFLVRGGGKATGAKFKNITASFRDFFKYFFMRSRYSKSNEKYRKSLS